MPIITMITGGIDFSNWFIALDGNTYTSLAKAQEANASTLNYGVFLTEVINFLIMAFVIFMMVKTMNSLARKALRKKKKQQKHLQQKFVLSVNRKSQSRLHAVHIVPVHCLTKKRQLMKWQVNRRITF